MVLAVVGVVCGVWCTGSSLRITLGPVFLIECVYVVCPHRCVYVVCPHRRRDKNGMLSVE